MDGSVTTNSQAGYLNGFLKILPLIQWILMISIAVGMYYLSIRDSKTSQVQQLSELRTEQKAIKETVESNKREQEKVFQELKGIVLTKDVFDAYHINDVQRMERMEKLMEQVVINQNR